MKTTAAVLVETGSPLILAELEIPALRPGQVLVEVYYSGVCHTQLLEARGFRGEDRFLPHCMGHEGSGVVVDVGAGVQKLKPGDKVVLSWLKGYGADVPGTTYRWTDKTVNAGGVTTFGRHSVVSENRLSRIQGDLPMTSAALLGCALPTGIGAVINVARPMPGQSLVVFGAGGVGLSALLGGLLASCAPILVVDVVQAKLEAAFQMGATHVLDASAANVEDALRDLLPGGADFAIEATGRPQVMDQALRVVRPQGGTAVVVGNARQGEPLVLDPKQLNLGKRLLGTWGGDTEPDRDFPRYARLMEAGRLDVTPLLSGSPYPLEAVNLALDDLENGVAVRPLIDMRS